MENKEEPNKRPINDITIEDILTNLDKPLDIQFEQKNQNSRFTVTKITKNRAKQIKQSSKKSHSCIFNEIK